MPAAATDDWKEVEKTAVAIGNISEAARRHGVSVAAACQRAKREKWQVGRRPAKALAAAREAVSVAVVAAGGVRTVRTEDVLADLNADHSRRGRSASLEYGALTTEHAARLARSDPEAALERAPLVASAVKTLAQAGDWQQASAAPTLVLNLTNLGDELRTATGRVIESQG